MALLAKFASRKLAVVLATVGVALIPTFVEKVSRNIDWRIYALAGGYVVLNVVQKLGVAWIQTKAGASKP